MRKFCIAISLVVAGLFIGIATYLHSIQEKEIFNFSKLADDFQFSYNISHKELMISTPNGGKINALFLPTSLEKSRGLVFYCHGKGSNMSHPKFKRVAKRYTDLGFDFFIFDYRGTGKSQGSMNEADMLDDCDEVYQLMKKTYPEELITIHGKSLGTSFATYIASKHHPRTLILEAPFFNLIDIARTHLPNVPSFMISAIVKYSLKTNEWLTKVDCPVYLMHGTADPVIPHEASEKLKKVLDQINRPADLLIIEGGDHSHLFEHEAFNRKIEEALGL